MEVVNQLRELSENFVWSAALSVVNIEGRGSSVICDRDLLVNEVIIRIPPELLINLKTLTCKTPDAFETWTTHEILAFELLTRKAAGGDRWIESLPQTFDGMPVSWDAADRDTAPNQARISQQLQEITAFVQKAETDFTADQCSWAWKAVNTRCLYWSDGGMTLAPAVDYLNHTFDQTKSLNVTSDFRGITVSTTRSYTSGEELTFCYGPHDNGYLLTEYGFVITDPLVQPSPNTWDFVDITNDLVPLIPSTRKSWLESVNYWGDYTIDLQGEPSFRTQVALSTIQSRTESILNNIIYGYDDGSRFRAANQMVLKNVASAAINRYKAASTSRAELAALYRVYIAILDLV